MYYGVQYYPEHWPSERWEIDADLMRDAGVNGVRVGEFAWSAYEPSPGKLDFSWMDRALDLLHARGIGAIMCTCSRTPPPWMYKLHPEIVNRQPDGRAAPQGSRYRIGLLHPAFAAEAERIDRTIVQHFAGHPAIVGWQVDNEVGAGNDCFCPVCVGHFREYLREKYGSVEALNRAWGEHFWSFRFNGFDEVPAPGGGQLQLELEYRRFLSKVNVDFARRRVGMIHELDPGKPVTTNCQSIHSRHNDWHAMSDVLDAPSMNHYPPRTPELTIDLYRRRSDRLLVLEQFTRLQHTDAGPGWMRLWAWMTIAHGAAGVNFFRWRQCRWGQEQFADGLLPHSGKPNRLYEELKRMGEEVRAVAEQIDGTRVPAEAAVALSYDSRWAVGVSRYPAELDGAREGTDWHEALKRRNVPTDGLDPRGKLTGYKLIVAPRLWLLDKRIVENAAHFVEDGGLLVLTAGTGVVDEFGKSFDTPRPGPLADLAGVEVSDLAWLGETAIPLRSELIAGLTGPADGWADEIHPVGAEVLAEYADGWREGAPAITKNRCGDGTVLYVGTRLGPEDLDACVAWLCGETRIESVAQTPPGVSAHERRGDGRRLLFLLNYTQQAQSVPLDGNWRDALTGETCPTAEVPPVDMRLLVSEG